MQNFINPTYLSLKFLTFVVLIEQQQKPHFNQCGFFTYFLLIVIRVETLSKVQRKTTTQLRMVGISRIINPTCQHMAILPILTAQYVICSVAV